MERLQSPTTELSEGLGALRLGQLQDRTYTHTVCSQTLVEGSSLSGVSSDLASACGEGESFSEQEGIVEGWKDHCEVPQCSLNVQSGGGYMFDSNHDNKVPLVFSHLEPTRNEPVCSSCVPVPCGMEPSQQQTCQNCGQRHILTEDGSCLASSSSVPEAETLLDGLESLSVSSSEVANGNHLHEHPAMGRGVVTAPEHSCGASNSVSDGPTHWVWSRRYSSGHASRTFCHSCRTEAMRVYYPDDVTVDELAGYFDQLLYLPRPMSEMAELMYT